METTIHQYIKNKRGQLTGVVLATVIGPEKVGIGWSLANAKDNFSKTLGVTIAENRAHLGTSINVPHSIKDTVNKMAERAARYFKGCEIDRPVSEI